MAARLPSERTNVAVAHSRSRAAAKDEARTNLAAALSKVRAAAKDEAKHETEDAARRRSSSLAEKQLRHDVRRQQLAEASVRQRTVAAFAKREAEAQGLLSWEELRFVPLDAGRVGRPASAIDVDVAQPAEQQEPRKQELRSPLAWRLSALDLSSPALDLSSPPAGASRERSSGRRRQPALGKGSPAPAPGSIGKSRRRPGNRGERWAAAVASLDRGRDDVATLDTLDAFVGSMLSGPRPTLIDMHPHPPLVDTVLPPPPSPAADSLDVFIESL